MPVSHFTQRNEIGGCLRQRRFKLVAFQGIAVVQQLGHELGRRCHIDNQVHALFGAGQGDVKQPAFFCLGKFIGLGQQDFEQGMGHFLRGKPVLTAFKPQDDHVIRFQPLRAVNRVRLDRQAGVLPLQCGQFDRGRQVEMKPAEQIDRTAFFGLRGDVRQHEVQAIIFGARLFPTQQGDRGAFDGGIRGQGFFDLRRVFEYEPRGDVADAVVEPKGLV